MNIARQVQNIREYGGAEDVKAMRRQLQEAIAEARRDLREFESLLNHAHQWNEDDYCDICGADGRS